MRKPEDTHKCSTVSANAEHVSRCESLRAVYVGVRVSAGNLVFESPSKTKKKEWGTREGGSEAHVWKPPSMNRLNGAQ